MFSVIRCALAVSALGLLIAGCSGGHARESRSVPKSPERTTGQAAAFASASGGEPQAATTPHLIGSVISPEPRHDITLEEIRQHVRDKTAVLLDVRGARDFERGHVRGAVNVPASQLATQMNMISQSFAPSDLIIIYCNGPYCGSSDMVYEYLASQGYNNMRVFKPGWEALAEASDLQ